MSSLRSATVEELEAELRRREASPPEPLPKKLSAKAIDRLWNLAEEIVKRRWADEDPGDDAQQWAYETLLQTVYGPDIFAQLNSRWSGDRR